MDHTMRRDGLNWSHEREVVHHVDDPQQHYLSTLAATATGDSMEYATANTYPEEEDSSPVANRKRSAATVEKGGGLTEDGKCMSCELGTSYRKGHHISCPKSAYYNGANNPKRKKAKNDNAVAAYADLESCKNQEETASAIVSQAEQLVAQAEQHLLEVQDQLSQSLAKKKAAQEAVERAKERVVQAELEEPDDDWNVMFHKLKEYRDQHRNNLFGKYCEDKNKTDEQYLGLCRWVKRQRKRRINMRWTRKAALDSMDFPWDFADATWHDIYQDLLTFRNEHGHFDVPKDFKPFPYLWLWVETQRRNYVLFKQGEVSNMTTERIQLLKDIGFVLDKPKTNLKLKTELWDTRFGELVAFKEACPDLNMEKATPVLRRWVQVQRSQYKFLKEGKKSLMTEERVKRMDDIGFPWKNPKRSHPTEEDLFRRRFQELAHHKNERGTFSSISPAEHRILHKFCETQRANYRLFKKGQLSSMTPERIKLFDGIGFDLSLSSKQPATQPQT